MHVNNNSQGKKPVRRLNARGVAFLGLLLAFALVLTLIGGYTDISTLSFMAAAAFCTGIAIRECGLTFGGGFGVAGVLLAFMLAPNKLYVMTYACMSLYIFAREWVFDRIAVSKKMRHPRLKFWIFKYLIFNVMYIPVLIFLPEIIFAGYVSKALTVVLIVAGQIVLFIYDRVYDYFQYVLWGQFRKKLKL